LLGLNEYLAIAHTRLRALGHRIPRQIR
jgi:hypothetical protein